MCNGCSATYYGKASRNLKIRSNERLGIGKESTILMGHLKQRGHTESLEDFCISSKTDNSLDFLIRESLLIQRDNPCQFSTFFYPNGSLLGTFEHFLVFLYGCLLSYSPFCDIKQACLVSAIVSWKKMALGLYSLLEACLLVVNAMAVLNEERFLSKSK